MNVQIRGHRTEITPRWRNHINERLAKLARFEERIIKIDLVLRASHHHLKGNEICRITAKFPRKTISLQKKADDMIAAIDAGFHVLERKVQTLWKPVKTRSRHSKVARRLKRGG